MLPKELFVMDGDDWILFAQAIAWYKSHGFEYISTPWIVPQHITKITIPTNRVAFNIPVGDLVGSAEQAFLWQVESGAKLPLRCMSLGPCFRDEYSYGDFHRPYFMKLELFSPQEGHASEFRQTAKSFMSSLGAKVREVSNGDLEVNNVEVGSYIDGPTWSCGTGLALPRFNEACNRKVELL